MCLSFDTSPIKVYLNYVEYTIPKPVHLPLSASKDSDTN